MIRFIKLENKRLKKINQCEPMTWIQVNKPDQKDKDFLLNELKLPIAFYNDVEDPEERPRLEVEDDWLFVVLRVPLKTYNEDLPYYTVPLGIMLKEEYLVTISFFGLEMIEDFLSYSTNKKIDINNFHELTMRLFVSSSVWFSKYLKQINRTITITEDSLDKRIENEHLESLFNLEKSLIYFTTALTDHTFLYRRLNAIKAFKQNTDDELREDVEIELLQAQNTTNIYYNILRRMEDSYDSRISNNLNIVMKRLTSISIILMIPTLVASFYGMNVPNFLEHNNFAFIALTLLSFIIAFAAFIFFKKIDWF